MKDLVVTYLSNQAMTAYPTTKAITVAIKVCGRVKTFAAAFAPKASLSS
jgi:hypothetical protein